MPLSKLQKLNPSAIGKCAMVFVPPLAIWKMKKLRCFNTIAPWPMLVRQSLYNLQRCGAFIVAFKSEKLNISIKKSLFRNWQVIPNFFIAHLAILVRCKSKGTSRSGVRLIAQLAIRCLSANYCTSWRCNFKGLSQDGGHEIFF
jgi:hypothetical protein